MLCCETHCHACRHNDFEGQQLLKVYIEFLYSSLTTSLLWRSTVVFTYLKVKSVNGVKCFLCLLPVVLVLLFWSWS